MAWLFQSLSCFKPRQKLSHFYPNSSHDDSVVVVIKTQQYSGDLLSPLPFKMISLPDRIIPEKNSLSIPKFKKKKGLNYCSEVRHRSPSLLLEHLNV